MILVRIFELNQQLESAKVIDIKMTKIRTELEARLIEVWAPQIIKHLNIHIYKKVWALLDNKNYKWIPKQIISMDYPSSAKDTNDRDSGWLVVIYCYTFILPINLCLTDKRPHDLKLYS